jgi:macrodomain Ter protein organizer (MatP/YcbG family)
VASTIQAAQMALALVQENNPVEVLATGNNHMNRNLLIRVLVQQTTTGNSVTFHNKT